MNLEIVDGITDFDDTINIINDDKHIYVDIEHGTIMLYYDSGDEDCLYQYSLVQLDDRETI